MKLISVEDLIKILKEKNIDLGKGDPYNRIRYYTKIGWIPHMVRKKNESNVISGHYTEDVIEKIMLIEKMKSQGLGKEEITKKIKDQISIYNRYIENKNVIFEKITDVIKKHLSISKLVFVLIIVTFLVDILFFRNKDSILKSNIEVGSFPNENMYFSSGETFIPKGQNKIFINQNNIKSQDTVLVSLEGNIFPASFYFISEVKEDLGFYIETNLPVSNEVKLKWVLIKK